MRYKQLKPTNICVWHQAADKRKSLFVVESHRFLSFFIYFTMTQFSNCNVSYMYHPMLPKDITEMKSREETIVTTLRLRTARITMMGRMRRATGSMHMIKTVTWYQCRSYAFSTLLSILQYFIQYHDFMLVFVCCLAVCYSVCDCMHLIIRNKIMIHTVWQCCLSLLSLN